jgi:Zn-dependent protease
VTMTRQPGDTRAGSGAGNSQQPERGLSIAGITVGLSRGAYLLAGLTVLACAAIMPAAVPGLPMAAYLAATAGLVAGALASLTGHELAHALVARRYGARERHIMIGFSGGRWHGGGEFSSPRALWRVAAVGPAASLALAGIWLAAAAGLAGLRAGPLAVGVFAVLAWASLLFVIVSALPVAGLDGGRIVHAWAWARGGDRARATVTAARIGQYTGALLAAGGVILLALGYLDGIWAGLTGLVMAGASRAQAQRALTVTALAGLTVRDILPAGAPAVAVPGWQSVQFLHAEFADGRAAARAAAPSGGTTTAVGTAPAATEGLAGMTGAAGTGDWAGTGAASLWPASVWAFPVRDFDGRAAGLLTLGQLAAVPAEHRANLRITDIATPVFDVVTARLDEPLPAVAERLAVPVVTPAAVHTAGHALVVGEDGAPVGVLTPADFARARQLGALFAQPPLS